MSLIKYRIQSDAGVDLGTYAGENAQGALDAMAVDAGYRDHRDACDATGMDSTDWTSNPYKFRMGRYSLLVTEVED